MYNLICRYKKKLYLCCMEINLTLFTNVLSSDEMYRYAWRNEDFDERFSRTNETFKYLDLSSDSKSYDRRDVKFFTLMVDNLVVAVAHIRQHPNIDNHYWLSYLCVDEKYRGNGYASKLSNYMFSYFKVNRLIFETSSYTEDGMICLKPLFNKLSIKHDVEFIDKGRF